MMSLSERDYRVQVLLWVFRIVMILSLAASGLISPLFLSPAAAQEAVITNTGGRYVAATNQIIADSFLDVYDSLSGKSTLGPPISPVVRDNNNREVQYFAYGRLEQRDDGTVQQTPLGSLLTQNRPDFAFRPQSSAPTDATHFFSETGHAIREPFATFWEQQGGAERFGLPVSRPFTTVVHDRTVTAQYFTHARLEQHVDGTVHVGTIGWDHARQVVPESLLTPRATTDTLVLAQVGSTVLAESHFVYPAEDTASRINVSRALALLHGVVIEPGERFSFLQATSPLNAANGYVAGQGIVQGRIQPVMAGSICYVSTMVFRVAADAGLEIVHRQGHTMPLASLQDIPGFDAAVFSPSLDLQFRNNTPYPIMLTTAVDPAYGHALVQMTGQSDGRRVVRHAPVQTASGYLVVQRDVYHPDGRLLSQDMFPSGYTINVTEPDPPANAEPAATATAAPSHASDDPAPTEAPQEAPLILTPVPPVPPVPDTQNASLSEGIQKEGYR